MTAKVKVNEWLFVVLFAVGTLGNVLEIPGENPMLRLMMMLGGFLCFIRLTQISYDKKSLIIYIVLIIVSFFVWIKSGEFSPLVTSIILFFSRNIDFDKIIDWSLFIRIVALLLIFVLLLVGLRTDSVNPFWRNGHFIERHTFGYQSSNTMQIQYSYLTALLLYKYYDKMKIKTVFFMMIVNAILYYYTKSRTGFLLITMILMLFLFRKKKIVKKIIIKFSIFIMPIIMFVSYFSMFFYGKIGLLYKLDELLTGRLGYCHTLYTLFGFSLFGANVSSTNIIYDNSYVRILINLGILYSLFLFIMMFRVTWMATKQKNTKLLLILITFQLIGFTESIYGYIFSNITLFLINSVLKLGNGEK